LVLASPSTPLTLLAAHSNTLAAVNKPPRVNSIAASPPQVALSAVCAASQNLSLPWHFALALLCVKALVSAHLIGNPICAGVGKLLRPS
jgi:hypothetical protein